ncbi:hypothetical protein [Psychroserpens luteus]|uniref:MukB N-terminal domain-containing protein n=1 Tax=Psychroserpens luteus TaxID=1434066 RepID=A0ABW5ZV00_9FLAO|nr:hypothetical protein [Psychroserpens luteus]
MNKLPLIHSISTVGVIKHYNQDYLIHDIRTDFTGPNGIGKSLLADLLQILFIAERKKIHFGTDSVKKEHRQIHTIPYKTPNAYFFLNIEVEHKTYITFGVNIPNSSASQIKLFRILNEPFDSEKDSKKTKKERQSLGSSLIPEHKLVYQDDFITKGTKPSIPSIDVLTKHLRDEKELYLDVFTRKAERNELYQFFFDKNILPLNLSQETHLTAFAKVLQAFSKANTLETDKDESLKSFLFENKKNAIEAEYKQNKQNLDDYVERYKNLSDLISSLTVKREYLEVLEELSITHKETEKEYLLNKFYTNKNTFKQHRKTWDDTKTKVDKLNTEIKKHIDSIPSLEEKQKKAIEKFKSYSDALSNLNTYKNNFSDYLKTKQDLYDLNDCKLPKIVQNENVQFDFKNLTVKQIIQSIKDVTKVIGEYKTSEGVEEQYQKQNEKLNALKNQLLKKKSNIEKLSEILELKDDTSFASQLLNKKQSISLGQETVLRSFLLDTKWNFPEQVVDQVMYTTNLDILNEAFIKEDEENQGWWYNIGGIKRFIKSLSTDRLFGDKDALSNAFSIKKQNLITEITQIDETLSSIKKLEQGQLDGIESLNLDFNWDVNIPDQRKVEEYKSSVIMIHNLDTFKADVKASIADKKEKLDELSEKIPFKFSDKNLDEEINKCSAEQSKLNTSQLEANGLFESTKALLNTKTEELEKINYDPKVIEGLKNEGIKKIEEEEKTILIKYPSLKSALLKDIPSVDNLTSIQEKFALAKTAYESSYKSSLTNYKELKDDIEVRQEIEKETETFEYKILEKKLLGNDIVTTKNIEKALGSIHQDRNKLASTIINTMLKIFHKTQDEYDHYKSVVTKLNTFFKGELISNKYYFQVVFKSNDNFNISWINNLSSRAQTAGLFESDTVEKFVEEAFKDISGYSKNIEFSDLLDPKTYFTLKTEFKDSDGKEYPGSTGESYTARVLLGIGRLSITSKEKRDGLRFLILEEVSNLDDDNFNTFPQIAQKYGYQIITMTPEPFGSNKEDGWYLHQLLEGKTDKNCNYPIPNSSFKTNYKNEQLQGYLKRKTTK